MELWIIVAQAFWLIAPAYAANAFPPLVKGKRPLDFGKKLGKNRLLGDGKTFEGTISGIIFGLVIGLVLMYFQPHIAQISMDNNVELGLAVMTIPLILLLSIGAVFGDIAAAFVKRRLSIPRGASAPLLDQLDFVTGALIFTSLVYLPSLYVIVFLYIITPVIHLFANIIGYYIIKVKNQPW